MTCTLSNRKRIVNLGLAWLICLIGCGLAKGQNLSPVQLLDPCERYIRIDRQTQTTIGQSASFTVKFENGAVDSGSAIWEPYMRFYKLYTTTLDQVGSGTVTVTVTLTVGEVERNPYSVTFNLGTCSPGGNSGTRMVSDDANSDTKRLHLLLQATLQSGNETQTGNKAVTVGACPAIVKLEGEMTGAPSFAGKTIYYAIVAQTYKNSGSLIQNDPVKRYYSLTFPTIVVSDANQNVASRKSMEPVKMSIASTSWTLKPLLFGVPASGWLIAHSLVRNDDGAFKRKKDGALELGAPFAQIQVSCGKIGKSDLPGGRNPSGNKKAEKVSQHGVVVEAVNSQ